MIRIIFFVIILSIVACNPVKQAFKPKYIEKTKVEFYSRGLCVNDTIHETTIIHDSTVIKDTIKLVEFQDAKLQMFTLDTVVNGVKVSMKDGFVSIKVPETQQVKYQTKTITKIVKDLGLETVLKNTINAKDSVIVQTKTELADVTKKYYQYKFILWISAFLIILLVIIRLYRIFKL
jgi:hypothetical protein